MANSNHIYDDKKDECSCGCGPHNPCDYEGCIHCDIPQNKHIPKKKRERKNS